MNRNACVAISRAGDYTIAGVAVRPPTATVISNALRLQWCS
jgi:hypothetical protein